MLAALGLGARPSRHTVDERSFSWKAPAALAIQVSGVQDATCDVRIVADAGDRVVRATMRVDDERDALDDALRVSNFVDASGITHLQIQSFAGSSSGSSGLHSGVRRASAAPPSPTVAPGSPAMGSSSPAVPPSPASTLSHGSLPAPLALPPGVVPHHHPTTAAQLLQIATGEFVPTVHSGMGGGSVAGAGSFHTRSGSSTSIASHAAGGSGGSGSGSGGPSSRSVHIEVAIPLACVSSMGLAVALAAGTITLAAGDKRAAAAVSAPGGGNGNGNGNGVSGGDAAFGAVVLTTSAGDICVSKLPVLAADSCTLTTRTGRIDAAAVVARKHIKLNAAAGSVSARSLAAHTSVVVVAGKGGVAIADRVVVAGHCKLEAHAGDIRAALDFAADAGLGGPLFAAGPGVDALRSLGGVEPRSAQVLTSAGSMRLAAANVAALLASSGAGNLALDLQPVQGGSVTAKTAAGTLKATVAGDFVGSFQARATSAGKVAAHGSRLNVDRHQQRQNALAGTCGDVRAMMQRRVPLTTLEAVSGAGDVVLTFK